MGFFDKIKAGINKLTGGGATVTISMEGNKLSEVVKVNITAVVKDAPIDITKVYVWVKSVEKVDIPKKEVAAEQPFDLKIEKIIYAKQEYVAAPAQKLEAGQTYTWSYEVKLSGNTRASYYGTYVQHEWQFLAGLDAKGNDPDSEWIAHRLDV
jgi:hypothetical protein